MFKRIVDWFIPEGTILEKGRARIFTLQLFFLLGFSLLFFPITIYVGSSFRYDLLIICISIFLVFYKITGSTLVVSNIFCGIVFILLAQLSTETGRLYSHDTIFLFIVPLSALVFSGYKSAVFWIVPVIGYNIKLYIETLDSVFAEVSRQQTIDFVPEYYLTANLVALLLPILLLFILDRLSNRLMNEIEDRNIALAEVNKKLTEKTKEVNRAKSNLERSNTQLMRYAHTISHDLKQPIRTIISFTQLLERNLKSENQMGDESKGYLNYIVGGTKRLDSRIDSLLKYSENENSDLLEDVDLNFVLFEVKKDLKKQIEESNASITNSQLPILRLLPNIMNNLFQNLISNAIKYRRLDKALHLIIDVKEEEEYWEFSFTDNGRGINEEDQKSIFERYIQIDSNKSGAGIGLSICGEIVNNLGGTIWVVSKLDIGSTFYFTLHKNKVS